MAGLGAELLNLLAVFILAAGVGIAVAKVGRFPYTVALLLAGLAASVLGVELGIELSHDVILLLLLPPLLFEGAATTDLEHFRANLPTILALAVPGLLVSVVVLGVVGQRAFGWPLLVSLLFAAMILPTDPVSVLALFDELGAPDRLATLVEGESLLNDGVGVVVFRRSCPSRWTPAAARWRSRPPWSPKPVSRSSSPASAAPRWASRRAIWSTG